MTKILASFLFLGVLSANASLIGGLPATPGGADYQVYYDTVLNISWTADANLNGADTWDNQVSWAESLTINSASDWRLASMDLDGDGTVVNCSSSTEAECRDNEYGHLFYYGGGLVFDSGITAASPDPFSNVQSTFYWSSTEATVTTNAWGFVFGSGGQSANIKSLNRPAWAVHQGNVIPVPAAVWLFGSALGLLGWVRNRSARS